MWIDKFAARLGGYDRAVWIGVLVCVALLAWIVFWKLVGVVVAFVKFLAGAGARKRRRRAEKMRKLQFTLPKVGNSYVRARLHTALGGEVEEEPIEEEQSAGVKLDYAKKLLFGVKQAALSPVERLDVEEMAGAIALYDCKERWTGGDRRAVNELLARLLKLSAKYEVAV